MRKVKLDKTAYDKLRQHINIVIHGVNTPMGKLFDIILLFVILLSVVLVLLETVENLDNKYRIRGHKAVFRAQLETYNYYRNNLEVITEKV